METKMYHSFFCAYPCCKWVNLCQTRNKMSSKLFCTNYRIH